MARDKSEMTECVLNLTLEILFELTGEDYRVMKKMSSECSQAMESESWRNTLIPIRSQPQTLIHKEINKQKILELTNKITELLTGEVPIRCQDAAVYFSMEEWEYLEEHKDLYKDVVMEDLYMAVKVEDQQLLIYPDDCIMSSDGHLIYPDCKAENDDLTQDIYEEHVIISDLSSESSGTSHRISVEHPGPHNEKKSYSCSECGKSFAVKSSLVRHKKSHTGEKPFSCSKCNKHFSQKSNLIVHLTTHLGEKKFSCSECGKLFSVKTSLVRHEKSHTGEKPYSCSECDKCFTVKSALVQHQRCHTGEKPFPCSECGKRFSSKSALIQHHRCHTGEKPFSCSECGKSFTYKSTLVHHQRCHTREQIFSSSEREKGLNTESILVLHQQNHSEVKPNSC